MAEPKKYLLTKIAAAKLVIKRVSEGKSPDVACKKVGDFDNFSRRQFFDVLRKNPDLLAKFEQAMEDYLHMEAYATIRMADELAERIEMGIADHNDIAATDKRIKARQWLAERVVKKFQPTIKNEHSGKLSLTVSTGVPRLPEQIRDAEHRVVEDTDPESIDDLL